MNQGWSLKWITRMTVEIFIDTHQQNIIYQCWQTSKDQILSHAVHTQYRLELGGIKSSKL